MQIMMKVYNDTRASVIYFIVFIVLATFFMMCAPLPDMRRHVTGHMHTALRSLFCWQARVCMASL